MAFAVVPTLKVNGAVIAALRPVPFIARCPGCERTPYQPDARSCDRLGCPVKHFVASDHVGHIIPQGQRNHA